MVVAMNKCGQSVATPWFFRTGFSKNRLTKTIAKCLGAGIVVCFDSYWFVTVSFFLFTFSWMARSNRKDELPQLCAASQAWPLDWKLEMDRNGKSSRKASLIFFRQSGRCLWVEAVRISLASFAVGNSGRCEGFWSWAALWECDPDLYNMEHHKLHWYRPQARCLYQRNVSLIPNVRLQASQANGAPCTRSSKFQAWWVWDYWTQTFTRKRAVRIIKL